MESTTGAGVSGPDRDMRQSKEIRARIRLTAIVLALIALGFYFGFILVTAGR